jgi:UPF0716 protein FxsA
MLGLFGWLTLEFATFVAIAQAIGFGGAFCLGIVTSMAGMVLLRQAGNDAWAHLRAAMSGGRGQPSDAIEGLIGALAAFLLILPGFVSDLLGLALAAPSVRQFLGRKFDRNGAFAAEKGRQRSGIIDLAPDEWASIEHPAEPARR